MQKYRGMLCPVKLHPLRYLNLHLSARNTDSIPAYTKFQASVVGTINDSNTAAIVKLFYNIEDVPFTITPPTPVEFVVYEAKRFIQKAPITLDEINQSIFIPEIDIDFRTLRVFVNEDEYAVVTSVYPTAGDEPNCVILKEEQMGTMLSFLVYTIRGPVHMCHLY
jgi:hypothetical protein